MDATSVKSVKEKFQLRDLYRTTLWNKKEERKLARAAVLAEKRKAKKRTSKRDINNNASSGSGGGIDSKAATLRNQLDSTSCCLFKPRLVH